ncbi:MAG: ABC-type transporter, periplasmic subunit [Ilumatobacteraceae bacterium]|nr:ABC-type transporter, periplasmic subunit [Ilumatobacteraceae bacterium]
MPTVNTSSHTSRASRRWRFAAPFVLGALVLAACGSDKSSTTTTAAPATTTAAGVASTVASSTSTGGSAAPGTVATTAGSATPTTAGSAPSTTGGSSSSDPTIVVGAVLEPTSLDLTKQAGAALDAVLLDNIYETLLKVNKDGTILPGVAALPTFSADRTTLTMKLQDGVTFSDGKALSSADVKWSLDTFRAKGNQGAAALASITAVAAPDASTVVITLSAPDNDIPFSLTRRYGAVLEANATNLEKGAVGTGPFTFTKWNVGSSIQMTRNPSYWGTKPKISGATFQYFTDPNAAINAMTTGDVDILTGGRSDLVAPLQDNSDFTVTQGTTNGEFTLGFNNSRPFFSDVKVRTAIRQGIDKQGFIDLNNGFGTLIGGPVPPTDPWYEDLTGVAPYDKAAAKQVIDDAGLAGTQLDFEYPNIYPETYADYVKSQLAEIDITVNITPIEFSVWLDKVFTKGDYDLTMVNHVEPHDIGNYANKDYYWHYDSPTVQKLIADAKTASTEAQRDDLLKQAAKQISEDSPVDWLFLASDLTVAKNNITGYPTNDSASRFNVSGVVVGS